MPALTLTPHGQSVFGAVRCSNSLPCSEMLRCGEAAAPAPFTPGSLSLPSRGPGSLTLAPIVGGLGFGNAPFGNYPFGHPAGGGGIPVFTLTPSTPGSLTLTPHP